MLLILLRLYAKHGQPCQQPAAAKICCSTSSFCTRNSAASRSMGRPGHLARSLIVAEFASWALTSGCTVAQHSNNPNIVDDFQAPPLVAADMPLCLSPHLDLQIRSETAFSLSSLPEALCKAGKAFCTGRCWITSEASSKCLLLPRLGSFTWAFARFIPSSSVAWQHGQNGCMIMQISALPGPWDPLV